MTCRLAADLVNWRCMDIADTAAIARLEALPRAGLGHFPTPLHRLDRLSDEIGTELWIKRDDVQGVALAGNKIRKFDLVLGRALADGYDTLVTTGAIQSNSARTGAAAAAAVGLRCVLVLSGDAPPTETANLLIDRLVGADIRFVGDVGWQELNQLVEDVVAEAARDGRRAFAAPVGCSSPLGSLGFALGYLELRDQLHRAQISPAAVIHTSSSGGTAAGLIVGRSLAGDDLRVVSIDVAKITRQPPEQAAALARAAAALVDHDLGDNPLPEIYTDYIGSGYGHPTPEARAAIILLARTEGILADPIYSGKGLAGMLDLVRARSVAGPVVFWHTGGFHAMFDPQHGTPLLTG